MKIRYFSKNEENSEELSKKLTNHQIISQIFGNTKSIKGQGQLHLMSDAMPRIQQGRMSKHWVFTINNYTDVDYVRNHHTVNYIIHGREVGTDGTKHLQGYVFFKNRKRLTAVKKLFPRAHLEIKRGTAQEAIDYCKKDGDFDQEGTPPVNDLPGNTGERWQLACDLAEQGKFDEIPRDLWIRYIHAFLRIRQLKASTPDKLATINNLWIVAPSGYGKSTYAWNKFPEAYDKMPNKWWIAYKDEKVVILDDWSPKECEYMSYYLKRWADAFPFMAETKGSGRFIRPVKFVVTSQYNIDECFDDWRVIEAIKNRFNVLELTKWEERVAEANLLQVDEVLDDAPEPDDDEDITTVYRRLQFATMRQTPEFRFTPRTNQ